MVREALSWDRLAGLDRREAAALFAVRRAEGLSEHEAELLEQWLNDAADNRLAYDAAARAWSVFDGAEDDELLGEMRDHALATSAVPAWRRQPYAAVAAVLVALLGVTLFIGRESMLPGEPVTTRFATGRGEVQEIRLADGTAMTVDAESTVLARYAPSARSVELVRGRAYFDVARDADRPFTVTASRRRIVVVGTSFEVDRTGERLEVTLIAGRLRIEPVEGVGPALVLNAGSQFVEQAGRPSETQAASPEDRSAAWREGLLDFEDTPLGEAAALVNRYADAPLIVRDPAVSALRISGQFRAGDSERFARTVAEVHRLSLTRRQGGIELLPAR